MTKEFLFKECFLESLLFLIMMSLPVFSSRNDFSIMITRLHVSTHAVAGGSIQLDCEYDLGEELLYSVKWYKNNRKFYSYLPESIPSIESFPQPGVDVDLSKSGENIVNLRNLSLESSGSYTCQVCSEAPYFLCNQTTKKLVVIRSRNVFTLNITSLHVPTPVMAGDGVLMRCEYDIGQESLHAVKWYKNKRQFYGYVPQSDPANVTYPSPGVDVDLSKSGTNFVYLRNVSWESSGNYTCRVYIDTPYLLYIQKTKQLEVVGSRNASTFKITSLHVPTPVVAGDSILLRCEYDLGEDSLYALKWYKNNREFYRYLPFLIESIASFSQPGVDIDLSKSGTNFVYIRNVSLESFGNYTCEICSESPSFICSEKTKQLEVIVFPSDGPLLLEEKSDYEMGDNVSLLCESGKSKPAPDLKWYINDQMVKSDLLEKETVVYLDQMESTGLVLNFRLTPEIFHNGKVTVKCVATIYNISAETTKEILVSVSSTDV